MRRNALFNRYSGRNFTGNQAQDLIGHFSQLNRHQGKLVGSGKLEKAFDGITGALHFLLNIGQQFLDKFRVFDLLHFINCYLTGCGNIVQRIVQLVGRTGCQCSNRGKFLRFNKAFLLFLQLNRHIVNRLENTLNFIFFLAHLKRDECVLSNIMSCIGNGF